VHESDLRREHRVLAHERLGAVDRIDQPEIFRVAIARSGLLAVEAVLGKTRFEQRADGFLAAG
jgi:hypothetical protein